MGYGSGMSCWHRLRDWQQHVYRSMIWVYADNVALCRSTINRVIALALRETRAIVSGQFVCTSRNGVECMLFWYVVEASTAASVPHFINNLTASHGQAA
jgi:hypothetical protein